MKDTIFKYFPWDCLVTSCDHGFNVTTPNSSDTYISDATLADVDRALPVALRLLSLGKSSIHGSDIRRLVKLWSSNAFVPTLGGSRVGISDVADISLTDTYVAIDCTCIPFKVQECYGFKDMLRLPYGDSYQDTLVSRKWLDEHHPAWLTRFTIATDLDLPMESVLKAMVEVTEPVNNENLPGDISF